MLQFEIVNLEVTRACPLACAHCITDCSPQRTEKMDLDQALTYIREMAGVTEDVAFTGGEPFLYRADLLRLVRCAEENGLRSCIVTGAGWIKSNEQAYQRVEELVEAGLSTLVISWDVYHERFLPIETSLQLAQTGIDFGLKVVIFMAEPPERFESSSWKRFSEMPIEVVVKPLVKMGRAKKLSSDQFEHSDGFPKGACKAVLKPLILHDDTVLACCGAAVEVAPDSPLVLGNGSKQPLHSLLENARTDPLFELISIMGPYGICHVLGETELAGLYTARPSYSSICELCKDLVESPEVVKRVRQRLNDPKVQSMLVALSMWSEKFSGSNSADGE